MKITEIAVVSDASLSESIEKTNDSGILTEELVKVVRADESAEWSEAQTADDLLAEMESWGDGAGTV